MAGDGSTVHTARNLETAVNSYRQGGHGHATLLQFGVRATWLRTPAGRTAFTGILRYHVHSAGRPSKCRFSEPNLTFANTACWHLLVGTPLWNLTSQTPRLQKIDPRALTLAYKMPLTGTECEWGAGRGRGASGSGEGTLLERRGSPGLRPGPATARWCP